MIDENAFVGLLNLKELLLHNNRISFIHPSSFAKMPNILQIFLHFNQLVELDPFVFAGLKSLSQVCMHNNNFKENNLKLMLEPSVTHVSFIKSSQWIGNNDIIQIVRTDFYYLLEFFQIFELISFQDKSKTIKSEIS
jgi:Leucine-rich repeat (LRR) protein